MSVLRLLTPRSLRVRIALASVLVVGIALGGGAFGLVRLQLRAMDRSIDSGLSIRADDIESQVLRGALETQIAVGDEEIAAIQVLDGLGGVVASSANLAGYGPMLSPGGPKVRVIDGLPFEDEEFRVLSRHVSASGGSYTIFVAGSRDDALESAATLARSLWVGVPLAMVVSGAGTWLLVGRALSPVESMRREVAAISESQLQRRVAVSDGGDEIARLARTMNAMLSRIESAYEKQQVFVADAAHELRSPLASLRTQLEVGHATEADILAEVVRLQRLANDLLILAAAGSDDTSRNTVDLDDVVFEEVSRRGQAWRVPVDVSGVSAAAARVNRDQFSRVVQNLLENANRHARSSVRVSLREDAGTATLVVTDDGPGVPAADHDRIFERFARTDTGRDRNSGGAGLGLAICRAIVESFGGIVSVDLTYQGGARFVVRLPSAVA